MPTAITTPMKSCSIRTAISCLVALETDRPHVFKVYGSYKLKWGTEAGGRFYGGSGTPITTRVENLSQIPIMVNGRADAGRLPFLNTTDFLVSHEFKMGETKTASV